MVLGETLSIPGFVTELLWSNASPGSAFGEQTLTISNLSDYAYVICGFSDGTAVTPNSWEFCPNVVDYGIYVARLLGTSTRRLMWVRANNQIYFSTSSSGDNTAVKPLFIYGVKGALV